MFKPMESGITFKKKPLPTISMVSNGPVHLILDKIKTAISDLQNNLQMKTY